MPKVVLKTGKKYDLTKAFTSTNGYDYANPGSSLILWALPGQFNAGFEDLGSGDHTISFAGIYRPNSGPLQDSKLNNIRTANEFVQVNPAAGGGGKASYVSDADDLSFGDGATGDTSFSMSLWIKLEDLAGTPTYLITKYAFGGYEYYIYYQAGTLVAKLFKDGHATHFLGFTASSATLVAGEWSHIVFTYNASEGTTTDRGAFYLNGTALSVAGADDNSYNYMAPGTAPLMFGAMKYYNATQLDQDHYCYEYTIWSGKVLTSTDVAALYDVKNGLKTGFLSQEQHRRSGLISQLPRNVLNIRDSKTGSYPTTARTGDTRTGVYNTKFDDRKTLIFGASSNVTFGSTALSGSYYQNDLVASPSSAPTLKGSGKIVAGVSDSNIQFTKGEDLKPFVEENLYAITSASFNDPFYTTGSAPADVGLGFTSPVRSKTKIEIDLNPDESTMITFSTGTAPNASGLAAGVNSGIAYYNFERKRYEIHGDLTTGSNVDYFQSSSVVMTASYLSFCPSYPHSNAKLQDNAGFPISTAGFPFDQKFNPTGSQFFNLSGTIQQPFLVEKMVYEFSGTMPYINTSVSRANIIDFFIMREAAKPISPRRLDFRFNMLRGSLPTTDAAGPFICNRARDIVSVAQVSLYNNLAAAAGINALGISRDLNIQFNNIASIPTGSFVLSSSIDSPLVNKGMGLLAVRNKGTFAMMRVTGYPLGGRTGTSLAGEGIIASPRSLVKGVAGFVPSSSNPAVTSSFVYNESLVLDLARSNASPSPYILFPSDKLIFGWANQQQPTYNSTSATEAEIAGFTRTGARANEDGRFTVSPGKGKLTLYGSLVKEGKEFHYGLNQPLTSDAIHEDIQDTTSPMGESNCLDQYDTQYAPQLSGTYVDYVMTGSLQKMLSASKNPEANVGELKDSRGFLGQGSKVAGSGSCFRGVNLIDANERFYDTLLPKPDDAFNVDGAPPVQYNAFRIGGAPRTNNPTYLIGHTVDGASILNNTAWNYSFPFEPKYAKVTRVLDPLIGVTISQDLQGNTISPRLVSGRAAVFFNGTMLAYGSTLGGVRETAAGAGVTDLLPRREFSIALFGVGSNVSGTVGGTRVVDTMLASIVDLVPRGWKYGLKNALPEHSKIVMRRDTYGQYRDMMEQRNDTKFYNLGNPIPGAGERRRAPGVGTAAIQVRFKKVINNAQGLKRVPTTANETTQCSNMSMEATSSLPFFDGKARNRFTYATLDSQSILDITELLDSA